MKYTLGWVMRDKRFAIKFQNVFKKPSLKLFKRSGSEKRFYLLISDLLSFTLSVIFGYFLSNKLKIIFFPDRSAIAVISLLKEYPVYFGLPMIFIILMSEKDGHYSRFKGFWEEYGEFFRSVLVVAGLTTAYLFLMKQHFSRLWLVLTWLTVLVVVPISRMLCKLWMMRQGKWFTPTIVIGSGQNALQSALAMESNRLMGFRVVALMDVSNNLAREKTKHIKDFLSGKICYYPVMPFTEDSLQKIIHLGAPYFVLALEPEEYIRHHDLIEQLAATRHNMSVIPPIKGIPLLGSEISPIFRHEVLHVRIKNNLARKGHRALKFVFDMVTASLLLVLLSPMLFVIALIIRRDGGSAFYYHERIGMNRKPFKCIKFRSMRVDADKMIEELLANDENLKIQWDKDRKLKNDPRITGIGHFLRKTSLDELPQLINVLRGEMSLVGPRPVVEDELKEYGFQVAFYLNTRPGMTGLWQISGRNDIDYSTRVNLDVWYVRNWSLWYDIIIMLKTLGVVFRKTGAY